MKYFQIRNSLDAKIMGKIPQVKEVIYHCNVTNDPLFVAKIYYTKVNYNPIVANPILYSEAQLTDLIEPFGIGSIFKILISSKLRDLLIKYRKDGIQFFQCSVFKNGIEYNDYSLLNMYVFNNEFIDYKNSKIILQKKAEDYSTSYQTIPIQLNIPSQQCFNLELEKAKLNEESLLIQKLTLFNVNEDFFLIKNLQGGGIGYFVSENLKNEIENSGCTGIEFQPSGLSYDEWISPDGEREKVYGKSW